MTHCLPGEMHELATVLAGAADNAFVSEAVALRLHHVFPLQNLSLAFPVPFQEQQLLVSLGDLSTPGFKSLQVLERDKSSLGYGQGLHRQALGQPDQPIPPASYYIAEQIVDSDLDQALRSTVLAAELLLESDSLLSEATEQFRVLAAELGACLASQASSVPLAAAAFLGWRPPRSYPKAAVRGTCNKVLPHADRDNSPETGLSTTEPACQQPADRHSMEVSRPCSLSAPQIARLSNQPAKPHADYVSTEHASLQLGAADKLEHSDTQATTPGSACCAPAELQSPADCQAQAPSRAGGTGGKLKEVNAVSMTTQHPFWLTFNDKKLEQQFTRSFGEQLLVVEPLYYVPMLWGMYILAFTYNYSLEPEPCFGLQQPLAGALLFLSVLAWGMRLFDRSLYLQHRELCVSLVRLLVGALFAFSVAPFVLAHPVALDPQIWWRDLSTCTMVLYLAMSPLLLMIRFRAFLPTQLAAMCMLVSNIPTVITKYLADFTPVAAFIIFGLVYFAMGLVVPIVAICTFEQSSRKAFLFRHNVAISAS